MKISWFFSLCFFRRCKDRAAIKVLSKAPIDVLDMHRYEKAKSIVSGMKYQVSFLDVTDISRARPDAHVGHSDWADGNDCM